MNKPIALLVLFSVLAPACTHLALQKDMERAVYEVKRLHDEDSQIRTELGYLRETVQAMIEDLPARRLAKVVQTSFVRNYLPRRIGVRLLMDKISQADAKDKETRKVLTVALTKELMIVERDFYRKPFYCQTYREAEAFGHAWKDDLFAITSYRLSCLKK